MFKANPYRPGAGLMPQYLAGRDEEIKEVEYMLDSLQEGLPTKSVIYSGLRGVGKTVLLNRIEELADERQIFYEHIEIAENGNFIQQMTASSKSFLRKISSKEKAKIFVDKALDALKALTISFNPDQKTFSLSLNEQELYLSEDLTQSLTEVLVELGKAARESEQPIAFFIDEIQFMKKEELSALISALHRTNQLSLPIMIFGAGLPKVFKLLGDVKSYSERLFEYRTIGSLDAEQARRAITNPSKKYEVTYDEEAVREICLVTGNYPFFLQQLCSIVWNQLNENTISLSIVKEAEEDYVKQLDEGFYKVRYERCTDREKAFIRAMVDCGELPCTIANVAKNMKTSVSAISPIRAQLISKGIIYAVQHGELDFTVPGFDEFLIRQ